MEQGNCLPVLICAYARNVEFQSVLSSAIDSGSNRIYVNLDGTSNPEILFYQELIISKVREFRNKFPDVEIILRRSKQNLGAACSVISSADWFFSKEEFGIILEDDLEFDDSFFKFMSWAAGIFKNDDSIWILSGSNFLSMSHDLRGHLQLPNYPVTWGWATWREKWQFMREELIRDPVFTSPFQFDPVLNFWGVGSRRAKLGMIDAWDIPLAEIMQRLGKTSLVSPINLVRNIGYSALASNTNENHYPLDIQIDVSASNYNFETSLGVEHLQGEELNKIYERDIYGISMRHSFTSLLSLFDYVRFREKVSEPLATRLSKVTEFEYEVF